MPCCARPAPTPETSAGSQSGSARGASRACGSGSRLRAGSRSPSRFRSRESRRSPAAPPGLPCAPRMPVAGASPLAPLAAGPSGAVPVVDARRREVFVDDSGSPRAAAPGDLRVEAGATYVGNGAVRYRAHFESAGSIVPPDDDERHLPRARFHALIARDFGPAEAVEPLYVRVPDADRTLAK